MRLDYSTGDLIWIDNNSSILYYWDQSSIQTVYTGFMHGFQIDNGTVVYSFWDGGDYEIATWAGGSVTQWTSNTYSDAYPVISGSRVAWMRTLTTNDDWEIMTSTGGPPIQLSSNSVSDQGLAMHGSDLFWLASNPEARVWRYDGSTAYPVSAVGDYACDSLIHDADGDHATWIATYGAAGDDREVVYYDGSTAIRLTDNLIDDAFPKLSGDRVVWQGRGGIDGGMDYEIFLYDGGTTTQLTVNDLNDEYPDVSATHVVWIQTDSPAPPGDRRVMVYDGTTTVPVTTSIYFPDSVLLYNDLIYMCLDDGTDREIFKAEWLPDPTATPTGIPAPTDTPTPGPTSPPPVVPVTGSGGIILLLGLAGLLLSGARIRCGRFVLLIISLSVTAGIIPAARSAWQAECIDCRPAITGVQADSLNIDGSGQRVIACGFDYLYLLHKNGSEWDLETVDPSPGTGLFASLRYDSQGYAHISYFDDANNHLKYARETVSGWDINTLDTTPSSGYHSSLRLDGSENPHIAYGNNSAATAGLYYAWFDGAAWQFETVQDEHVAFSISLGFNGSGQSCIAYMDYYDRKLKYAVRDNGTWTIEILVSQDNCGYGAAMIMDTIGLPHILYDCNGLRHAWYNGTQWQTESLNSVWSTGISLRVDASNVLHATWMDEDNVYYGTWDGAAWSIQTVVSLTGNETPGGSSLLLPPGGMPEIAYYFNNVKELRYAVFNGSSWDTSFISRYESPGGYGSLALDSGGFGHASYIERNFHALRYAWQDAQGWQQEDLDTDSYVFYTDIALDSSDHVHIGYYSTNPLAFKHTTNTSGDWVTTTVAVETGQYCRIAVDPMDHVHAIFEDTFLGGCRYGMYDGSDWMVETLAPPAGGIGGHLDICVASDGTPHVSFLNNVDMNLGYAVRTAGVWQFQMNVDTHYWTGEGTSIVLNSQGYPRIAYNETQSDDNLRIARWNGAAWDIEVLNGDPSWTGSFASLTIDAQNYLHVACVSASYDRFLYYFENAAGWHVSDGLTCGEEPVSLLLTASNEPLIAYEDSRTWDYKIASYAWPTPPTVTPTSPATATPTPSPTSSAATATPTFTPTFTPTQHTTPPTHTPTQATPPATHTPTATPTHTPTPPITPTPSPTMHTPTPPPSPSPTDPGGCDTTGVTVEMPLEVFHAGDICWCRAVVCNAGDTPLDGYPLFVILDVYGSLYWAPSFNTTFDHYLALYSSFPPGSTVVEVLPSFPWPDNTGTASGLLWYGALTNPEITDIFGDFDVVTFGWETD